MRRELWELAQEASGYLRRHASPAVRLATALLLAASLAACNASTSDTTTMQTPAVAPLQQEVSSGLPRGPGTYPVVPGSVFRDQRGVYQMEWLEPEAGAAEGGSASGQVAYVSRLRLVRDDRLVLEVSPGEDPVLHLPEGENVGLIQEAQVSAPRPGPSYYPPVYSFWSPFTMGLLLGGSRPAYYDPPQTIVVPGAPGAAGAVGGGAIPRVEGGTVSETARPPAQRVTGVRTAVSGRAGGTGAGSAVTGRNVGSGVSPAPGAAPGAAGSASSRPAAGSPGSSGGSGVTAPRSGGFSGGGGSSAGSAAS